MSQWGMDALGLGKNVSQYYVRNNKPILPFPANLKVVDNSVAKRGLRAYSR
jgi:hypothetical protein